MQAMKIAELHDKSNIKCLCQEWVKCRANAKKMETSLFSLRTRFYLKREAKILHVLLVADGAEEVRVLD